MMQYRVFMELFLTDPTSLVEFSVAICFYNKLNQFNMCLAIVTHNINYLHAQFESKHNANLASTSPLLPVDKLLHRLHVW